jgi:hypothetical protein
MNNKDKYKILCQQEDTIMVNLQPWWLDAVCGSENWDVTLLERDNQIIAAWPFHFIKKRGFKCIQMPELTKYTGIWMRRQLDDAKNSTILRYEMDIYAELIKNLPSFDHLLVCFNDQLTNWQPFYWTGFNQSTKYTYVVENIRDWDAVYNGFTRAKRNKLRKYEELIEVRKGLDPKTFYDHNKRVFESRIGKMYYSFETFKRIYDAAKANNAGEILYASDSENNILSATFIVWDKMATYMIIASHDLSKDIEASGWLIYEAIKFASSFSLKFDFYGNMNKSIEFSHRHHGAKQVPIYMINKTNSKILKPLLFIRDEILK